MIISRLTLRICKGHKGINLFRRHVFRYNCTHTDSKILERLSDKSVLRVSGNETSSFLQGLITNDMKCLEEGAANIYTLFLNIKGRVMYDALIYKNEDSNSYYIECHSQIAEALQRHLKMYRVKRKIDIDFLGNQINVWAMYDSNKCFSNRITTGENDRSKLEGMIFPCGTLNNKASKFMDNIMIYEDPRLPDLGFRILAASQIGKDEIIKHLNSDVTFSDNIENYKAFRYKLGIGEGTDDLPPGKAFPLEINCDYLHGVSFHKGCYIGQELTARTYHTGVVRKRLMPLIFDHITDKPLAYDEKIVNESGNVVGKFRGYVGKYGLGLMRISESLAAQQLNIVDLKVKVIKPDWWPQEIHKEIVFTKNVK